MYRNIPFLLLAALSLGGCGGAKTKAAAPAPSQTTAPTVTGNEDRAAWAKKEGLLLKQFDLNRDGEPDIFKFYREVDDPKNPGNKLEQLVRKDLDINHDGTIDIIRFYDDKGQLTEERVDLDFDGRFDSISYFKEGVLSRQEIDINFDGKPDVTKYFDNGQISRIESDRNGDGRVDTWEYFINGELDRVGTDADMDGNADTWERKKPPETPPPDAGKAVDPAAAPAPSKP